MTKITSLKQITANKLNAQKSTGPRTENGKAWARRNAIKHGLRSVDVITVGENPSEFEQFNQQMLKELQPVDLFSMQLVNKIVITAWNLKRSDKIQSGILAYEMQSYEADEYKNKLQPINHSDFAKEDATTVTYHNLIMGLSFLRDCNSGNAIVKLGSYETRLLHRYTQLHEQFKAYKKEHYESR